MNLKKLIGELSLFERERTLTEVKILGIVTYIQTSSTRRTAKILSEFHPVSHTAIWKWIRSLRRNYLFQQKKQRNLIAIDETVVKANKKRYYVFSAIDVERDEVNF